HDAEAIGRALDVVEQLQSRLLHALARVAGSGDSVGKCLEQGGGLAVDDDGVKPLLAATMFVDDWLRHVGAGGDLLDGNRLKALLREERSRDVEQLLATLSSSHP